MTVPDAFVHPIPEVFSDSQAAPLLCAGSVGWRSLRLAGLCDGQTLGLTGFGASGHLVLKTVLYIYPRSKIFVFARSAEERNFARELGAAWAGETADVPPEPCDAIIDTTPAWGPVVEALKNLKSGGRLVINAIRKEDNDRDRLLHLDYATHLWLEKEIKSVANVTRADVGDFLELAAAIRLLPEVQEYPLAEANIALAELGQRKIRGAKVLRM
jgi:propanol-preferring alcohol dehydrogenase